MRGVHYLNQFFGQLGGEDRAGLGPRAVEGPVGPGLALQRHLGEGAAVVRTLICSDNHFADHQDEAAEALLALLDEAQPDLLVAGPAFSAGRYGLACAHLCQQARRRFGLAAVTGLSADNPAVATYRREVIVVPTGPSVAYMASALAGMAAIGLKLALITTGGQVPGLIDMMGGTRVSAIVY